MSKRSAAEATESGMRMQSPEPIFEQQLEIFRKRNVLTDFKRRLLRGLLGAKTRFSSEKAADVAADIYEDVYQKLADEARKNHRDVPKTYFSLRPSLLETTATDGGHAAKITNSGANERLREARQHALENSKRDIGVIRKKLGEYYGDSSQDHQNDVAIFEIKEGEFEPQFHFAENNPSQASPATTQVDRSQIDTFQALPSTGVRVLEWNIDYFRNVLKSISRCDEDEGGRSEDLRIWTTAFNAGSFPEEDLSDLLKSGVRMKILLMDPQRKDLVESRNRVREDETPEEAIQGIRTQIERLSSARNFPRVAVSGGTFELRVSDLLPFGFVLHTNHRALIGLLWAHTSFSGGQMIEVDSSSDLWKTLLKDWKKRWDASYPPGRRPIVKDGYDKLTLDDIDEFFGDHAVARACEAEIVIPVDSMDTMLQSACPSVDDAITFRDRVYKARTWINRWDTSGAEAIRREIHKHTLQAPKLVMRWRHHDSSIEMPPSIPFRISMGLGFTTETTKSVGTICSPWMRVIKMGEDLGCSGDTLCFHRGIKSFDTSRCRPVHGHPGFFRWLPREWGDSNNGDEAKAFIQSWLANKDLATETHDVWDYAMILRHTELIEGRRQVHFVLAGFTERGTAVAGRHLARQWPEMLDRFVRGNTRTSSRGDFLLLIEGPSNPDRFEEWEEVSAITPNQLEDISCSWSKRRR